jgi:hypothetical protein
MRSAVLVGIGVLLLATIPLWAQQAPGEEAPFWDRLEFETWNIPQMLRVLTDSPWSRTGRLVVPGSGESLGRIRYFAQWYSARTVREALVRQNHIRGQFDPTAENEFLYTPRSGYQVYLFAGYFTDRGDFRLVPLDAFEGVSRDDLTLGALLTFSSQEHSSHPDEAELVTRADTQELVGIRLTFRRAREAVPPAEAREGQVRLVCPARSGTFSVSFALNQMRRKGQPDL